MSLKAFRLSQKKEAVRKPGSVLNTHLSGNTITCILKRFVERWRSSLAFQSILHSVGVYLTNTSRYCRWSLTLRAFAHRRCTIACAFSSHRQSSFLWHYPHGHPHRTFSGNLLLSVRTFLHIFLYGDCSITSI